ncbi:dnaJ homolog subfamily C member 2 [Centruroides vittatus]|uniref:dnaJ homolog subfamily C member 2 n=1 Tax=Centruroides vittatus TaxID=120091 RepID=UPI00350F9D31
MLSNFDDNETSEVYSSLSAFTKVKVEPVGKWFEIICSRRRNHYSNSFHSVESSSSDEDDVSGEDEVEDISYLRNLDPKDWKNQDHYAVLGLRHKRFKASEEDLKKAYRKKVLRHHPDKRRNRGEDVQDLDHDYFSCITKAYEILGTVQKRQSYDSVDPEFDNDIPSVNANSKENFFSVFSPVFERNARWSTKKPVPLLGGEDADFDAVDRFYKFWYDFDSWREFSYLDEEEKERGENREERRWIEKQNKIARQRRKKEEMARIRQLVDNAYSCDPRIVKFKEEEKQRKLAQKRAKQEAQRAKIIEEEKKKQEALEAERLVKQKEEEEARALREKEKKEKEAHKKMIKKERKNLHQLCESSGYFAENDSEKVDHLQEVDKLCKLLSLERLQSLNEKLQAETNGRREIFLSEVKILNEQLEKEKEQLTAASQKSSTGVGDNNNQKHWSHDDLQLLVKAVNLFPAGTINRWEVVAAFICQHSCSDTKRTAKEVLAKAKDLQKLDAGLKEEVNKKAYEKMGKSQKCSSVALKDDSTLSERFENQAETNEINSAPWTAEEQKLLEQALKTYTTSTPDRWDKIALCIPGRTKKECMKRYKDLVEMVRAKKAAQAAASSKNKK